MLAATSDLTVADGSVISATGTLSDPRTGAYQIGSASVAGSGTGALIRVANGPQRLVARTNSTTTATLNAGNATFSGNAVMFDSSGANTLSVGLTIENAKFVALGAPRIGIGVDPSTYTGLALTDALQALLGQSGAQLTLRSQSSIDFADGTYNFGSIGFDAVALTGLDGGAVTVNADTISLGNSSAPGTVCATCNANNGTLAVNANRILFSGGIINTQSVTATNNTSIATANQMTVTLPVGPLSTALQLPRPSLSPSQPALCCQAFRAAQRLSWRRVPAAPWRRGQRSCFPASASPCRLASTPTPTLNLPRSRTPRRSPCPSARKPPLARIHR